jgi:UrcA family protein
MLKTALIAASLLALTSPALAANRDNTSQAAVPVANVDFSNTAAVRDVYAKLKVAATSVCSTYIASARVTDVDTVCVQRALSDAVRAADRPQLTAMINNDSDSRFAARRVQSGTRTAANPD